VYIQSSKKPQRPAASARPTSQRRVVMSAVAARASPPKHARCPTCGNVFHTGFKLKRHRAMCGRAVLARTRGASYHLPLSGAATANGTASHIRRPSRSRICPKPVTPCVHPTVNTTRPYACIHKCMHASIHSSIHPSTHPPMRPSHVLHTHMLGKCFSGFAPPPPDHPGHGPLRQPPGPGWHPHGVLGTMGGAPFPFFGSFLRFAGAETLNKKRAQFLAFFGRQPALR
jgi:hypothetical protein